jgi:hypothetical protein
LQYGTAQQQNALDNAESLDITGYGVVEEARRLTDSMVCAVQCVKHNTVQYVECSALQYSKVRCSQHLVEGHRLLLPIHP